LGRDPPQTAIMNRRERPRNAVTAGRVVRDSDRARPSTPKRSSCDARAEPPKPWPATASIGSPPSFGSVAATGRYFIS